MQIMLLYLYLGEIEKNTQKILLEIKLYTQILIFVILYLNNN